jgi:hypothetical protein
VVPYIRRNGLDRRTFLAASGAFLTGARPASFPERSDARPIVERRTIDDLAANDPAAVTRIRRAYTEMFAWSVSHPNDPRSWRQQRLLHARTSQRGRTDPHFRIHGSHHFFPWHRAYLYFHERILAWHLTGRAELDPTFRLPVWAWESDFDALNNPSIYTDDLDAAGHRNPLLHPRRFLLFQRNDTNALAAMTFRGSDFFGYPPAPGASNNGSIENGVHANIHVDVGDDMGQIATAANDPLFFAHHTNIDRLWSSWSALRGATAAATFDAWKHVTWTFADWDGSLVAVRSTDVIAHDESLRYAYTKPTLHFAAPADAVERPLFHSGSRWHATHEVRLQVVAARRVALKLRDIRVPGPGHFAVAAIVPGQTGEPVVLGTFIVLDHHAVDRANAYLDVSETRTMLLHPNGTRVVLMHDPHKHTERDFNFTLGSASTTLELAAAQVTLHLIG